MLRPWLGGPEPAPLHLVVCPFAGGSAGAFRGWRDVREPGMDVSLAIYPGRDDRIREPCVDSIGELADQLFEELAGAARPAGRLLLAGHSMGAQVAFETCVRLERAGAPPALLILSGCHAPHLLGRRRLSHLTDAAFFDELAAIGGCDEALQRDLALLAIFLPMLRADFRATEGYQRERPEAPLRTPALLICGSQDEEAAPDEVDAWRSWFRDAAPPVVIPGDHFYVTRRPRAFLGQIMRRLEAASLCMD